MDKCLSGHCSTCSQVKVQDIHIRFEDSVTVPGRTFAAGITLDTLEVKVCAYKALAVSHYAVAGRVVCCSVVVVVYCRAGCVTLLPLHSCSLH